MEKNCRSLELRWYSYILPSYKFLFEKRALEGRQPSNHALKLRGDLAAPAGFEIVPTPAAQSLVAYLLSQNQAYEYPEARPVAPPAQEKKEGEHK